MPHYIELLLRTSVLNIRFHAWISCSQDLSLEEGEEEVLEGVEEEEEGLL